jgi:hypothetical protein
MHHVIYTETLTTWKTTIRSATTLPPLIQMATLTEHYAETTVHSETYTKTPTSTETALLDITGDILVLVAGLLLKRN